MTIYNLENKQNKFTESFTVIDSQVWVKSILS